MAVRQLSSSDAAGAIEALQRRFAAAGLDLAVRLWDDRTLGPDGAGYRLVLCHAWSLRAMLLPPSDLRLGEAYLRDAVDVEGSMVAALHHLAHLRDGLTASGRRALLALLVRLPAPPPDPARSRVRLRGRRHSQARDAAAIRHHYDVGDDFYRRVLDRDLVYSCAYFAEADRDAPATDRAALDRAQRRKLDLVCRKLNLASGERLLDIGCGWGSLVIHAARHYDVRAVGVTLSENQARTARERVAAAGLSERVRIELRDYREVAGTFDAIASIGMVEHVGSDQLPRYFAHLRSLLAPGGRLLNHGITTGQRDIIRDLSRDPNSFIGRYVFPDGALVPAHHMVRHLEQAGFELRDVEQLRPHYARTTAHWVANLEADYGHLRRLVGDRTVRIWRAYLAGSSLAFDRGDLGVVQILGTEGPAVLPLDRGHLVLGRGDREVPATAL